ncbi:MAG: hypothetical protein LBD99_01350 [Candidatus Margulisbacteria bacterium]|jgi:hypothetical protein|nr:hypothetical protein [Candidatus Margulisiibacteriota bacterium]
MGVRRIIFLFLLTPVFLSAYTKLPEAAGREITAFALFNYDNLIADSYESNSPYIDQLAHMLSAATKIDRAQYVSLLRNPELRQEPQPVRYMLKINQKTKELSGYYFVDTDD